MNANQVGGGFKAIILQVMWLWAVLSAIVSMVVAGYGLELFGELREQNPDSALSTARGLLRFTQKYESNENIVFYSYMSMIVLLSACISAFLAELGCVCVTDSVRMLGTVKGRGVYYIMLGIWVGGLAGAGGLIAGASNLACGIIHITLGYICFRVSGRGKAHTDYDKYGDGEGWDDVQEANPGWTRATARLTRNWTNSMNGGAQSPLEAYYAEQGA